MYNPVGSPTTGKQDFYITTKLPGWKLQLKNREVTLSTCFESEKLKNLLNENKLQIKELKKILQSTEINASNFNELSNFLFSLGKEREAIEKKISINGKEKKNKKEKIKIGKETQEKSIEIKEEKINFKTEENNNNYKEDDHERKDHQQGKEAEKKESKLEKEREEEISTDSEENLQLEIYSKEKFKIEKFEPQKVREFTYFEISTNFDILKNLEMKYLWETSNNYFSNDKYNSNSFSGEKIIQKSIENRLNNEKNKEKKENRKRSATRGSSKTKSPKRANKKEKEREGTRNEFNLEKKKRKNQQEDQKSQENKFKNEKEEEKKGNELKSKKKDRKLKKSFEISEESGFNSEEASEREATETEMDEESDKEQLLSEMDENQNKKHQKGKIYEYIRFILHKNLKKIDLREFAMNGMECKEITELLITSPIHKLYINSYQIGSLGLSSLSTLISMNHSIHHLSLIGNKYLANSSGSSSFGYNIMRGKHDVHPSMLGERPSSDDERIDFFYSDMCEFSNKLNKSSVNKLDFSYNNLSNSSILPLLNHLLHSNNQLTYLNLSGNQFSEDFLMKLSLVIESNHLLEVVKLNDIKFANDRFLQFFESLKVNRSLKKVEIQCKNVLTNKNITRICELLKLSSRMMHISIKHSNKIDLNENQKKQIEQVLNYNRTIFTNINLINSSISPSSNERLLIKKNVQYKHHKFPINIISYNPSNLLNINVNNLPNTLSPSQSSILFPPGTPSTAQSSSSSHHMDSIQSKAISSPASLTAPLLPGGSVPGSSMPLSMINTNHNTVLLLLSNILQLNVSNLSINKLYWDFDWLSLNEFIAGFNQLCTLPKKFNELKYVQYMDLQSNSFTEFPPSLFHLPSLYYLNLSNNQISFIPSHIHHLPNLRYLYLHHNQIKHLPIELNDLHQLQSLNVSFNELTDLPNEFYVPSLEHLHANSNRIHYLPDSIGNMLELKSLLLSDNALEYLPVTLKQLTKLQWIELSSNPFSSIPQSILKSKNNLRSIFSYLQELQYGSEDFSSIKLIILGPSEKERVKFEEIVSNNALNSTTLNNSSNPNLSTSSNAASAPLHHSKDNPSSIGINPSAISHTDHLPSGLQTERKRKFTISSFQSMSTVSNHLPSSTPFSSTTSTSSTSSNTASNFKSSFFLDKRQLKSSNGSFEKSFANQQSPPSTPSSTSSSKFVGLSHLLSPRTNSIHSLPLFQQQQQEKDANDSDNEANISGKCTIRNYDWYDDDIKFNCFDIRGNVDIVQIAHQFYLSENSIYIIYFNLIQDRDTIDLWIQSILSNNTLHPSSFSSSTSTGTHHPSKWNNSNQGNSSSSYTNHKQISELPIVIVGSYNDKCDHEYILQSFNKLNEKYKNKFPSIVAYIALDMTSSNKLKKDIKELKNRLMEIAKGNRCIIHQKLPSSYCLFIHKLQSLKNTMKLNQSPPLITWKEFKNIGKSLHIKNDESLFELADFLYKLGVIIYFNDDFSSTLLYDHPFGDEEAPSSFPVGSGADLRHSNDALPISDPGGKKNKPKNCNILDNYIFLDNEWLIDIILSVSMMDKSIINNGRISYDQLSNEIWLPPKFPPHVHPILISLLQKLEILFPLSSFYSLSQSNSQASSFSNTPRDPTGKSSSLSQENTPLSSFINDPTPPSASTSSTSDSDCSNQTSPCSNNDKKKKKEKKEKKEKENKKKETLECCDCFIPSLLPLNKPNACTEIWPLFEDHMENLSRTWKFTYLPSSFFPKLIAKISYLPLIRIHLIWRNGLILLYNHDKAWIEYNPSLFILKLKVRRHISKGCKSGSRSNSLNTTTVCTTTTVEDLLHSSANTHSVLPLPPPRRDSLQEVERRERENEENGMSEQIMMLTQSIACILLELIQIFIDSRYKNEMEDISIICTHCIKEHSFDPYIFTLYDCQLAAARGKHYINCRGIRPIRIDLLAPDIALNDLEHLDYQEINIIKQIGEGSYAHVYRGTYGANTPLSDEEECDEHEEEEEESHSRSDSAPTPIQKDNNASSNDKKETTGTSRRRKERKRNEVAIKIIKMKGTEEEGRGGGGGGGGVKESEEELIERFSEFRREVSLMNGLNHLNLVELKGLCMNEDSMIMVTEYLEYGDLFNYLHKNENKIISWRLRLKIANDVASGMNYLHTVVPSIIHRDLKSPNILLTHDPEYTRSGKRIHEDTSTQDTEEYPDSILAKVADFGLSSALFHTATGRDVFNPIWLAPELMVSGIPEYNEKVDIYSFAIILWELLTHKMPFDEFKYSFHSQLEEDIIKGLRPTIPADCPDSYRNLIQSSWHNDPSLRPSFSEILTALNTIQNELFPSSFSSFHPSVSDPYPSSLHSLPPSNPPASFLSSKSSSNLKGIQHSSGKRKSKSSASLGKFIPNPSNQIMKLDHTRLIPSHSGSVKCMILVENNIWVATGDGIISVWSFRSRQLVTELKVNITTEKKMKINGLTLVDNQVWATTNIAKASIVVWDVRKFTTIKIIKSTTVYGALLATDTNIWCATLKNQQNSIHIRPLSFKLKLKGSFKLKKQLALTEGPGECLLQFHHQIWVGSGSHIVVFDSDTLTKEFTITGHTGTVHGLVSVGNHVWSCSTDKTIRIWDSNGNCLQTLAGHASRVFSLIYHDRKIWSGSWDKTIMVWDPQTFAFVQELKDIHDDAISAMVSVKIGSSLSELWIGSWDKSLSVISAPFKFEESEETTEDSTIPMGSMQYTGSLQQRKKSKKSIFTIGKYTNSNPGKA